MNQNSSEKEPIKAGGASSALPPSTPTKQATKGLIGADRRTKAYKRYCSLVTTLQDDSPLKPGPGKTALVTQGASLMVAYENLTGEMLTGKPKADDLVRVGNSLNRVLAALGIVSWIDSPFSTTKPDPKEALKRLKDWGKT